MCSGARSHRPQAIDVCDIDPISVATRDDIAELTAFRQMEPPGA